MSERPKLSDLLAQVSAQRTSPERTNGAHQMGFELACQRFAATFFETYDYEQAYQAVHPGCKLNGKKTKMRAAAYLDQRTRRGARTVAILKEMWAPVERVGIDVRLLAEWICEAFTIDYRKFYRKGETAGSMVVFIDYDRLTNAEFRAIKRVTTRTKHYEKLSMTMTETDIELRDPYRGVDQAIGLLTLHHRISQGGDGTNPLPEELTKVLESAARNRQKFMDRLPPSRVRQIIDQEARSR